MSQALDKLREYETVFVTNPDLIDDIVNSEVVDRVKGTLERLSGTLLREDRWGKRKLSFEIKKHSRGNYMLVHYAADAAVVQEFERTLRNNEHVIRFVTTRLGEVTDLEAKMAEVANMERDREASRQEAEAKAADTDVERSSDEEEAS